MRVTFNHQYGIMVMFQRPKLSDKSYFSGDAFVDETHNYEFFLPFPSNSSPCIISLPSVALIYLPRLLLKEIRSA